MKKYRKFFIIFIVLLVTGLLAWIIVWSCQPNYNRDYYLSLLRYRWSSEMPSFIKENERKIKNPASQMTNNEFNSFYDNASKPLPFLDFNKLAHDLTNTRLGTQNSNVDWEKLYKDVGLSQLATETAKKEQLRFYNIMAGVYGKNNILRLMQSVTQAPISNKNVVAYNQYSYLINSQRQIYGPDFVNTKEINANYQAGWWATNNIISVSTHEYGHAFDNFLSLTDDERSTGRIATLVRFNKNKMRDKTLIFNCSTIIINYFIKPALY